MTFIGIIVLLLFAAICATIGQLLIGYTDGGWVLSAVLSFGGAFLFLWLADKFHLPPIFKFYLGGQYFPILWALLGAAICSLVVALIQRTVVVRDSN